MSGKTIKRNNLEERTKTSYKQETINYKLFTMKLLIVTVVDQFEKDVLQLFKKSNIESFSGSDIEGYKNASSFMMNTSWFPSQKSGADSSMFFSFTEDEKIDVFFSLVVQFNENLETNNPIHAVVVPIERSI